MTACWKGWVGWGGTGGGRKMTSKRLWPKTKIGSNFRCEEKKTTSGEVKKRRRKRRKRKKQKRRRSEEYENVKTKNSQMSERKKTCNPGWQYRRGRVGRGVQPPTVTSKHTHHTTMANGPKDGGTASFTDSTISLRTYGQTNGQTKHFKELRVRNLKKKRKEKRRWEGIMSQEKKKKPGEKKKEKRKERSKMDTDVSLAREIPILFSFFSFCKNKWKKILCISGAISYNFSCASNWHCFLKQRDLLRYKLTVLGQYISSADGW